MTVENRTGEDDPTLTREIVVALDPDPHTNNGELGLVNDTHLLLSLALGSINLV